MKLKDIIESLTVSQAKEWHSSHEQWLYLDYQIFSPLGLNINTVPPGIVDAVEDAFDMLLILENPETTPGQNQPGVKTQKEATE